MAKTPTKHLTASDGTEIEVKAAEYSGQSSHATTSDNSTEAEIATKMSSSCGSTNQFVYFDSNGAPTAGLTFTFSSDGKKLDIS